MGSMAFTIIVGTAVTMLVSLPAFLVTRRRLIQLPLAVALVIVWLGVVKLALGHVVSIVNPETLIPSAVGIALSCALSEYIRRRRSTSVQRHE